MHPTNRTARVAGLLYLLIGTQVFSLMYVPSALIVPGNATATANNIVASEMLFRVGIVSELISATAFVFLVRALYRLLNGVNKAHASLMLTLVLISATIGFMNVVNNIAALTLFRGADFLSVFTKPQRDALGMLFLGLHRQGFVVNGVFWGLWLFPFGLLVMKSGFLPRILGILLIPGCFGYVAGSLTLLLLPHYGTVASRVVMILDAGELPIMLWLLIKGAKVQSLDATAAS